MDKIHDLTSAYEIEAKTVQLVVDGNQIRAFVVGRDLQEEIGGFGETLPDALRDLAAAIERDKRVSVSVVR